MLVLRYGPWPSGQIAISTSLPALPSHPTPCLGPSSCPLASLSGDQFLSTALPGTMLAPRMKLSQHGCPLVSGHVWSCPQGWHCSGRVSTEVRCTVPAARSQASLCPQEGARQKPRVQAQARGGRGRGAGGRMGRLARRGLLGRGGIPGLEQRGLGPSHQRGRGNSQHRVRSEVHGPAAPGGVGQDTGHAPVASRCRGSECPRGRSGRRMEETLGLALAFKNAPASEP